MDFCAIKLLWLLLVLVVVLSVISLARPWLTFAVVIFWVVVTCFLFGSFLLFIEVLVVTSLTTWDFCSWFWPREFCLWVVLLVVVFVISSFTLRPLLWVLLFSVVFVSVFVPPRAILFVVVVVIVFVVVSSFTFLPLFLFMLSLFVVWISVVFDITVAFPFWPETALEFWLFSFVSVFVIVICCLDFPPLPSCITVFVVVFEDVSIGAPRVPLVIVDSFWITTFSSVVALTPEPEEISRVLVSLTVS